MTEVPRVNDELVENRLSLAFGDDPIASHGTARTDAHLCVHAPRLRITSVLRMIEDCDVPLIFTTIDPQTEINPRCALSRCVRVALAIAADGRPFDALPPWHAQKKPAVSGLFHGEIDEALALPFQIEQITVTVIAHRPHLRLGHDRFARCIEQMINRAPLHGITLSDKRRTGNLAPVAFAGILEIVATIDLLQTPENSGLKLLIVRAIRRQNAPAVGSDDRVNVGAKIRTRILR